MMKKKNKKSKKKIDSSKTELVEDTDADVDVESDEPEKKTRTKIDYDQFVAAWRDADSIAEVAETIGIKKNSASTCAARLRKAGVQLKSFRGARGGQPIDVKRLNKIAAGKED